jgi:hypothetical protein
MSPKLQHNGMRPQDVIVLLKIISLNTPDFKLLDLSQSLGISLSEISDSISRSVYANLIAPDKKTPMRNAIYEFLIHGLPYVFPARPGALVVGVPTAYSAPPLSATFSTEEPVVWADPDGSIRGQEIPPFHPKQAYAAKLDIQLYEMLALIDALRVGKTREKKIAREELKQKILHESSY